MTRQVRVPAAPEVLRRHLALGGDGVEVTSGWIERDGVPMLPVSAEVHFSRIPREIWEDELDRIAAGGITVVAIYAIWIHHEEDEGTIRFDGCLDLRAFVDACADRGLDVFLRIGPWAHAEARNGGLPDWLLHKRIAVRTDDATYLNFARRWFSALAAQLSGARLFALQVENELYDDPAHLQTLMAIAREVGLAAPLWAATGWGGAQLPAGVLLPLFAGYSEAFWIEHDAGFDAASASNYYFSDERDEVGVGADTRDSALQPGNLDLSRYPYATCELGGGMAPAYHRRPVPTALDIAALAHTKLGSGSTWQGYYMFHDGRNPRRGLQESHATGSSNDFAELSYDFGAPLGLFGDVRPAFGLLRMQHHALSAFGAELARMPSFSPEDRPAVPDVEGLRWCVRSDGSSGFLFVTNHQPHIDLPWHRDVAFRIELADGRTIDFPAVDIAPGDIFFWPFGMSSGGRTIEWATGQPVTTIVWRGDPLLVLASDGECQVSVEGAVIRLQPGDMAEGILVLTRAEAADLQIDHGQLVLSEALCARGGWFADAAGARVRRLTDAGFVDERIPRVPLVATAPFELVRAGSAAAPLRTGPRGRASAPTEGDWKHAARFDIDLRGLPHSTPGLRIALELDWSGDVARAFADGRLIDDRFFRGEPWRLPIDLAEGASRIEVEILPLAPRAPVHLPVRARPIDAAAGIPARLDRVRVRGIQRSTPRPASAG